MRKINEVLRLKNECHLSNWDIARSCRISHSTVGDCLKRVAAASLGWPLPERLSVEQLKRPLYPEEIRAAGEEHKPMPD